MYVLVGVASLFGTLFAGMRFIVKGWLDELRPNHGSSMNDRVSRIEQRVDDIYHHLITNR